MSTHACTFTRLAFASFLFSALLSCGSGGGGGGGPSALISGAIAFPASSGSILEAEPNDNISQAHNLGSIIAGQTIKVVGQVTDPSDLLDGFKLVAPARVIVTATLDFDGSTGNRFDLGIFDAFALQTDDFVEQFNGQSSQASGSFHAQGTFFPVVRQFLGSGTYSLTLSALAAADPILERELNDQHGEAQYLGAIDAGQQVQITGTADSGTDLTDRFMLAVPADIDLAASLDFSPGPGVDFDLIYSDATPDFLFPIELARFDTPNNNPEVGSFPISGLTLVEVTVSAFSGSGAYTLTLDATAADDVVATARSWRPASRGRGMRSRIARPSEVPFGSPIYESMPGEVLVLPRDGADLTTELARRGLSMEMRTPGGVMKCTTPVPEGVSEQDARHHTLALVASLSTCESVVYSEPNFIYHAYGQGSPNDPLFNLQWHYAQIQLPAAWNITQGDPSIRIGVIDTGRTNHPDLVARLIPGFDFISNASVAGDGNGVDADETDVGDGQGGQPSSFHGTHVAGTLGASTDNAFGVSGVTWFGQIMHLRSLGKGGGSVFDISQAVLFSAGLANAATAPLAQRLDVINMSLGGPGPSQTFQNACTAAHNAGVVVVAAAGNENSTVPSFPGAFDNVISVAAVDFNAARAPYSNHNDKVDIAAPGGDTTKDLNSDGFPDGVLSTIADDSVSPTKFTFTFFQGTSMACPHVAGVAALILAVDPTLTPDQVESILKTTATDLGPTGRDDFFGAGLVNAFQAVQTASGIGQGSPPVLGLSSQALSFAPSDNTINIQVSNLGGGILHVTNVIPTTNTGGNWLSAARVVINTSLSSDTSAIAVSVDRTGLQDGVFTGQITVQSNDTNGDQVIPIWLQVDSTAIPANIDIFVRAKDAVSGNTVSEDIVNPSSGLGFSIGKLPAGSYFIYAGSDDDGDHQLGGSGDRFFGAFPTLDQPVALTIGNGQVLPAINFAVQDGLQDHSAAASKRPLRLVHR